MSQFKSTPQDLQNPAFTSADPFLSSGLQSTIFDLFGGSSGRGLSLGDQFGNGGAFLSPFYLPNSSGTPTSTQNTSQNPLVAGVGGNETTGLTLANAITNQGLIPWTSIAANTVGNGISNLNNASFTAGQAPSLLGEGNGLFAEGNNTAGNADNLFGSVFGDAGRTGGAALGSAGGFAGSASNEANLANPIIGRFADPNFAAGLATSPQTQAAITAATNPIINAFKETTLPGLSSQFTASGQRVGNGFGSSAFDMALNGAQNTLEGNVGATAGAIANNAYQTGLGINAQTPGMYQAVAQSQLGAGNLANQGFQTQLQGENLQNAAAQGRLAAANTEAGIGSSLVNAGGTLAGIAGTQAGIGSALTNAGQVQQGLQTNELNGVLQNLQAQALPRLVQQYGINQGLSLYQSQVQSLLQSLGLGMQAGQPAIAYNSEGSGNSSGSSSQFGLNAGGALK